MHKKGPTYISVPTAIRSNAVSDSEISAKTIQETYAEATFSEMRIGELSFGLLYTCSLLLLLCRYILLSTQDSAERHSSFLQLTCSLAQSRRVDQWVEVSFGPNLIVWSNCLDSSLTVKPLTATSDFH